MPSQKWSPTFWVFGEGMFYSFVQNLTKNFLFWNDELHIIWKLRNSDSIRVFKLLTKLLFNQPWNYLMWELLPQNRPFFGRFMEKLWLRTAGNSVYKDKFLVKIILRILLKFVLIHCCRRKKYYSVKSVIFACFVKLKKHHCIEILFFKVYLK